MRSNTHSFPHYHNVAQVLNRGIFVLILLGLYFNIHAQQSSFVIAKYDTDKGLSQSVVNCITQDSIGFMWIGTQDGLNRYDGNQFTVYPLPGRHGSNRDFIVSLAEAPNGIVYIATRNSGLYAYSKYTDRVVQLPISNNDSVSLLQVEVNVIVNYNNEAILVGTNTGLFYYNMNAKLLKEVYLPIRGHIPGSKNIRDILIHSNKSIFLGTDNGLIELDYTLIYRDNFPQRNHTTPANFAVTAIAEQSTGDLLLGTDRGIKHFSYDKKIFRNFLPDEEVLADAEITDIEIDRKGNMWASSFGSGLFFWQQSVDELLVFQQSSHKNSMPNNYLYDVYIDKSGLLWAGTYGQGAVTVHQRSRIFKQFPENNATSWLFPSTDVYAITTDKLNKVWMGTDNGLITYDMDKNTSNIVRPTNNQFIDVVYSLHTDHQYNIWIGTAGKGLYYSKLSAKNDAYDAPVLLDVKNNDIAEMLFSDILSMCEDSYNNLWVATRQGLVMINSQRTRFSSYSKLNSKLPSEEITYITSDDKGQIWLVATNQLFKYNAGSDSFLPMLKKEYSEKISQINNCVSDNNGFVWLGTEDGLMRYDPVNFHVLHLTKKDGLPDNGVYSLLTDDKNNLWITTGKGLAKVKVTKNAGVNIVTFDENDGINCIQFHINAIHRSVNNRMYMGCEKGVLNFLPDDVIGNEYVPPVVITDFKLFFETVPIGANGETPLHTSIFTTHELKLNHTQRRVSFTFAALNFTEPESNQYAFFMENMDKEWVMTGNERTANYILLPGEYTFKVKASNNDGIWNETGTEIHIIVSPPFYQTTWFFISVILFVFGITALFIQIRTRNLRSRQRELEIKVSERTSEVIQQKKELELQADKLNQINEELNTSNEELNATLENLRAMQSQLVSHEKMASLGQLTAGVAHEINNPINFINGNISPLKRDIDDLLAILKLYEGSVEKNKLGNMFEEVEKFKLQIDLKYTLEEIEALISGIKEGAQRTTDIVKGLRNFSRLDEDDMKLANVNDGIQSTVLILRNKIKNRADVQLQLGELPEIICYPGKLNQVFMNIISNAVDAMNETGGQITITTSVAEDFVHVSIRDNGKGIPQDIIERIFEPFFTTKDVGNGTGLGLSISYGIIKKHKGDIKVNSVIGEGSEFLITLPIQQNNEPEKGSDKADES